MRAGKTIGKVAKRGIEAPMKVLSAFGTIGIIVIPSLFSKKGSFHDDQKIFSIKPNLKILSVISTAEV